MPIFALLLSTLTAPLPASAQDNTEYLFLIEVVGDLEVYGHGADETYEAYFQVPITTEHQIPLSTTFTSPELVDYRFIRRDGPNLVGVATLNRNTQTGITPVNWQSWVLIRDEAFADRPLDVPLSALASIPEEPRRWLVPTDCAQINHPFIQAEAAALAPGATTIDQVVTGMRWRVNQILGTFDHSPMAFDAFYALNWGNSCTGHAHAAAALLRAAGIPARSLMVIPSQISQDFDMHWIIDYWLPGYGWVWYESSLNNHPQHTYKEVVMAVLEPHDEFPVYYPRGCESQWHSSDPAHGQHGPDWGQAHHAEWNAPLRVDSADFDCAMDLARTFFTIHTEVQGSRLTDRQQAEHEASLAARDQALAALLDNDMAGFLQHMETADYHIRRIHPRRSLTVFSDDLESGEGGWSHGGNGDQWQLGTPNYGPPTAHSGAACWGTNLGGDYYNSVDTWLLSPAIDLGGLANASLSFRLYIWVEENAMATTQDPLWMDISADGGPFMPLSGPMGGVNDDPQIPAVGGWALITLDLTKYVDSEVQLRFRFQSNVGNEQPGAYIDDVVVRGRTMGPADGPRRGGGRLP